MATELWRWQDGTIADEGIFAIGIADDGSVICGGDTYGAWVGTNAGTWDFVAVKLSANGTEEWRWQEGTEENDVVTQIEVGNDESAILIGYTDGNWSAASAGIEDFAVAKISSDGDILWRWQAGTPSSDYLESGALRADGYVFVVGYTYGRWSGEDLGMNDFAGAMLDPDGNEVWRWMNGTTSWDNGRDADFAEDNSIIICGVTTGSFGGPNIGESDLVVIKLSSDGDFLWAWQGGTEAEDELHKCMAGSDGSIYLAGFTAGDWAGSNVGLHDFAAAKLDSDGNEIWRWQEGTPSEEKMFGAAITADGSLFMAGYTLGNWTSNAAGESDFVIVKLHPDDGSTLWRWQEGNSDHSWLTEAASSGNKVVFGGNVYGDWEEESAGSADFAVILLESTGSDGSSHPMSSPTPVATPVPTPPSVGRRTHTESPVTVPPIPASTETPAPSVSGNTEPSSPSPSSSTSSSRTSITIISGVLGVVVGVIITGLVVLLLGKRHARRSAPNPQSHRQNYDTQPAQSGAPRPPPPDYHTACSQNHAR